MTSKLQPLRRLSGFFKPSSSSSSSYSSLCGIRRSGESRFLPLEFRTFDLLESTVSYSRLDFPGRFCHRVFSSKDDAQGPAAIDYSSLLQEDEFHRIANSTIHNLQEKLEEYGDMVQIDGFDVDYGNEVLTLKLGSLGTYVLNKQTPNRQIWLSSPVSGPSRFDWDTDSQAWVYRRTKANLFQLMETELENLCGQPLQL